VPIIVSDNSPLSVLIPLGQVDVLRALFGTVLLPPEVFSELGHPDSPEAVRQFSAALPDWVRIQSPTSIAVFPKLHAGETAAISLAIELDTTLLMDEKNGRRVARTQGLKIIGAVGVLEQAAIAGLLPDFEEVYKRIRTLHFHVSDRILNDSLARIEMSLSLRKNNAEDGTPA
jgi:predicted nucleic acid-binding protein